MIAELLDVPRGFQVREHESSVEILEGPMTIGVFSTDGMTSHEVQMAIDAVVSDYWNGRAA